MANGSRLHPKKYNSRPRRVNSGDDLVMFRRFQRRKIKIKAELKGNPAIRKEVTIWIKKYQIPIHLPGLDQVLKILLPKRRKELTDLTVREFFISSAKL